jgi:hypothetical protein
MIVFPKNMKYNYIFYIGNLDQYNLFYTKYSEEILSIENFIKFIYVDENLIGSDKIDYKNGIICIKNALVVAQFYNNWTYRTTETINRVFYNDKNKHLNGYVDEREFTIDRFFNIKNKIQKIIEEKYNRFELMEIE